MDPFDLDWGEITPEGFDFNQNQALHVFNFAMQSADSRRKVLTYIVGRIVWSSRHLPPESSHLIRIDTVGQSVSVDTLIKWRQLALSRIRERLPAVEVAIEFLV